MLPEIFRRGEPVHPPWNAKRPSPQGSTRARLAIEGLRTATWFHDWREASIWPFARVCSGCGLILRCQETFFRSGDNNRKPTAKMSPDSGG